VPNALADGHVSDASENECIRLVVRTVPSTRAYSKRPRLGGPDFGSANGELAEWDHCLNTKSSDNTGPCLSRCSLD
jgi:hypothetical protein